MTSSIAATTVSGALLRICVCLCASRPRWRPSGLRCQPRTPSGSPAPRVGSGQNLQGGLLGKELGNPFDEEAKVVAVDEDRLAHLLGSRRNHCLSLTKPFSRSNFRAATREGVALPAEHEESGNSQPARFTVRSHHPDPLRVPVGVDSAATALSLLIRAVAPCAVWPNRRSGELPRIPGATRARTERSRQPSRHLRRGPSG